MKDRRRRWSSGCLAQIRLRLALVAAVSRSFDRSRQIVVLFIAVVVGQFTITDPAGWIAPLRPLLRAPRPGAGGYLPSLVLALAVVGIGVAMRPVFEWSRHSRYLAHLGSSRTASTVADAVLVALLMLPIAAMLTAGTSRLPVVDGPTIVLLLMSVVLLAAWLRIAAKSLPLATAVIGASVVLVASIGAVATGLVILAAVFGITLAVLPIARRQRRRRGPVECGPSWRTGSPRVDVWLRLHVDALRSRSPWVFVPTFALAALIGFVVERDGVPASDAILLIAGLLSLWQLVAAAKTTALAMDSWRRSRVLRQLPMRVADRMTRALVSSAVLFTVASPAEAMSLHLSGNGVVAAWTGLAIAAPWVVLWSQSRVLLGGVLSWSAMIGVTLLAVASP